MDYEKLKADIIAEFSKSSAILTTDREAFANLAIECVKRQEKTQKK